MLTKPVVSLVVPTFNRCELLGRFLESTRSISVNHEVVVVDNASTDGTRSVVERFLESDQHIRYVRNPENIGIVRNYNKAFSEARGDFISVFTDDDLVLPGNFEKKLTLLEKHPQIGLVYSLWYRIDLQGNSAGINMWPGLLTYPYVGGRNEFIDLLAADYMAFQAVVFRRELYEHYGGFDEDSPDIANCGDWDMKLRYCRETQTAFLNEPLVCVAYHSQSETEKGLRGTGVLPRSRLAIWRKWLVDNENPPVLDERYWQLMADAFIMDLRYDFGEQQDRIRENMEALAELKRDSVSKAQSRFLRAIGQQNELDSGLAGVSSIVRDRQASDLVVWHAPLFDPSGYADEARSFLLGLDSIGVEAKAVPIEWSTTRANLSIEHERRLARLVATPIPLGSSPISVSHIFPPHFQRPEWASYTVGRTMFETDRIPADWVEACNKMDEIWVPSDFNIETFSRSGVARRKLVKIPGAIDVSLYPKDVDPIEIKGRSGFTFLSVFDWQWRKGWDVLLRAFVKEFAESTKATLVLKVWSAFGASASDIRAEILEFLRKEDLAEKWPSNIIIFDKNLPQRDLCGLYRASDAYVLPTRGEGWGRPMMEAMLMGLPVVATRWSGQLEFMNDANSFLIDCREVPVPAWAWRQVPAFKGHRWAEPSEKHLRLLMRRVVEDRAESAKRGAIARQSVLDGFNHQSVARLIRDRLSSIDASRAGIGTTASRTEAGCGAQGISRSTCEPIMAKWEGSQFVNHSLALVNREVCLRLAGEKNIDLSIVPYEPHQFSATQEPRFKPIAKRLNKVLPKPVDIHVYHVWPPKLQPPAEGRWVVIQPWEFGSIPRAWIEAWRDSVDDVWVPSEYVRDCYIRSGMPDGCVHVMPNGVDVSKFQPSVRPFRLKTSKRFRFLFVGGTIWRKGIDVLLAAYCEEFTAEDDVCLVIKDMGGDSFYRGQTAGETIRELQSHPNSPHIEYINRHLSDTDLAGLYKACHCLVHPYRGEGFGLPIAEAMASDLPVIVTGYGAALDFCNEQDSYLIPAVEMRGQQKRIGDLETVDSPWWGEPDKSALRSLMRHAFSHPEEAREKGRRAGACVRDRFTWERTTALYLERMKALAAMPIRRFGHRVASGEKGLSDGTEAIVSAGGAFERTGEHGVWLAEARRREAAGDLSGALVSYGKAFELAPRDADIPFNIGRLSLLAGHIEGAIRHLKFSLELDRDDPVKYAFLGMALQANDDPTEAIPHLEKAVDMGCAVAPAVRSLADAYLTKERFEEAIAIYENLAQEQEPNVDDVVALGKAYEGLGKCDIARECYSAVLEVNAGNQMAIDGLARLATG